MLDLDFEVDVLLEGCIDLVWSKFGELFFEEVDSEFDVEVLFLQTVDVLVRYINLNKMGADVNYTPFLDLEG